MTYYERLTLLLALIAAVSSLVSLVRTRKAVQGNAALLEKTEQRNAAWEKRIEKAEYRDAVREFLLLSTHCEIAGHDISSRTKEVMREKGAILTMLGAANIPIERREEIARSLEGITEPLNGLRRASEEYAALMKQNKELEKIIEQASQSGEPMDTATHDKFVKACSLLERQAYGFPKEADAHLRLWEKEFQRYREELTNSAVAK